MKAGKLMKKTIVIILGLLIIGFYMPCGSLNVYAEEKNEENVEQGVSEAVYSQLKALDLEELEEFYGSQDLATKSTFSEFLEEVIEGNLSLSITDFSSYATTKIKDIIREEVAVLLSLLILAFLSALFMHLSSGRESIKNIINLVFVCMASGILIYTSLNSINLILKTIKNVKKFSETIFPVLLVLMTASGGKTSSCLYEPLLSIISTTAISIFSGVIITLIMATLVLIILNNLVKDIKLNKLIIFCSSLIKWIIGVVFSIFIGYATVIGIMAGGKDGLSIKTAKYAINSLVPIVGGYLSSSFEIFRAGSIILKNSLGVVGLVIIIWVIIAPAIKMILHNLLLKFSSALIDIAGENSISNLMIDLSKVFNFLLASLMTVFLMVFIMLLLVVMTANLV